MRFTALVATLGLLLACGIDPEPPDVQRIEAVSVAPFHSQHLIEFKIVAPGSTAMQRLVEHVALDRDGKVITGETERWQRGRAADRAAATRDEHGITHILIDLTPRGAEHFHALTTRAVGTKLAVLANGTVIAAPVIIAPITGSHAELTLPGVVL